MSHVVLLRLGLTYLLPGLLLAGCRNSTREDGPADRLVNFAHLENLAEDIVAAKDTVRIIHIYSEYPEYGWTGDEDEGIACVDDAARAAVLYLRRYELTGSTHARATAEKLVRFLMRMQAENGLFYNFVTDNRLTINRTHPNSTADRLNWWTARAMWALGRCVEVLGNDKTADLCAETAEAVMPHIRQVLQDYGDTTVVNGRTYPLWLIQQYAADATSELLLGLVALQAAGPNPELEQAIDRLSEGIEMMQYGSVEEAPYGAHLSWRETWHGWGNAQTQALTVAGKPDAAVREGAVFYPWLLVNGWISELQIDGSVSAKRYPQIAYGVRCVVAGLAGLYHETGEEKWAAMAGLAASWLTGNNAAGFQMFDAQSGRGHDGINSPSDVNRNAGAESTIEALMALQEIEQMEPALRWVDVSAGESVDKTNDGNHYRYRTFVSRSETNSITVLIDLNKMTTSLVTQSELDTIIQE